ncbi:MAG: acyltransferase [Acidobacteriota bacterium]|nr:acyltransferase [Acidobacteriota bacterium]
MKNPVTNRLAQLDFLRAVAVFLVIGNHSAICPPETSEIFNKITTVWYRGGWAGVDLFFVLSGFLIAGLLFNEYKKRGAIDIKRFLIRRGFKIYPAFWFLILVTLAVNILNGEEIYRGGFLSELLFIQNYHPGIWAHTWSLAVEEHFYIFLSFLFLALLAVGRKTGANSFDLIPKIFCLIALVCLALRCFTNIYFGFDYAVSIEQTHLRIDSLFFGVFLSYLWNFRGLAESEFLQRHKLLIGLAGALCFVPAFVFELNETFWLETFGLTMLYLGGGLMLLALLKSDFGGNKILRVLAEIGKYSYSIYLWNLPTHFWLMKYTNLAAENWFLYWLIYFTGTLVLGVGTAKLVEYPVLRLRDKLMPSNVTALKIA